LDIAFTNNISTFDPEGAHSWGTSADGGWVEGRVLVGDTTRVREEEISKCRDDNRANRVCGQSIGGVKSQEVLENGVVKCVCGIKVAKKKGPKKWRLCNNRPEDGHIGLVLWESWNVGNGPNKKGYGQEINFAV
jgi:hypothetical protein